MVKGLATVYDNLSTLLARRCAHDSLAQDGFTGLRGRLQQAFLQVIESIQKGLPLTDAMGMHPKVFAQLDIMIIHAAEESGSLAESFDLLGQWHEFAKRIRDRILSGLALPFLLIHITALIVPVLELILGGFQYGSYLLSALRIVALFYVPAIVIIAIIRLTPQRGIARRILDRVSLKIPFCLGKALYRLALSRYCYVFHITSKAGMPITQCAELAIEGTGNLAVADLFTQALASVRNGNPFSQGLSAKLPPEFRDLWLIGEETGRIDETAERLARNNAESAEFWFREFGRWFPRFIYVCVSLVMIYYMAKLIAMALSSVADI